MIRIPRWIHAVSILATCLLATPSLGALPTWTAVEVAHPAQARGALVVLPGFGGDLAELSIGGAARPAYANALAEQGIATLAFTPNEPTLAFDGAGLENLERAIAGALSARGLRGKPLVIGGFSSGGTNAIAIAERAAEGSSVLETPIAGVFEVDAPLDFFRSWHACELVIQRASPLGNVKEARLVRDALLELFGHSPSVDTSADVARSPFTAFARDGGRGQLLAKTPVRAWTEPDVAWWMENRAVDYYGMNAVDAAALINQLRILGNPHAELTVTQGRGIRPSGMRHPHSWSIVDAADLVDWITHLPAFDSHH